MFEPLLPLTTISLLDSMSAAPIARIPLAFTFNGKSPVAALWYILVWVFLS
jgi:hypothetical protein